MPDPTGRVSHLPDMHRGMAWKEPVRCATTANGTLATAFANGQTVDGIVLATGDRILLKNQTAATANGIYVVNAAGAPTRAYDMDQDTSNIVPANEILGAVVKVLLGTANTGTFWQTTNTTVPVIGTDNITWTQLPSTFGVTSVGLSMPAEFSVAGSPVTSSGTLTVTKATESANTVWAGPTSGGAAVPAFRALVTADLPAGAVGLSDHEHVDNILFSGDGATTIFELPAAPFDAYSVQAFVAGVRSDQSLSGSLLTTMTFAVAPASGTNNIAVDIVAAVV